ncbi:hypothetical protein B0H13DRAFT_2318196 [Mycena leptocephala]|nr:hypothetical protein B0H13DRAFT_2318196 [Mycena leptocephala]
MSSKLDFYLVRWTAPDDEFERNMSLNHDVQFTCSNPFNPMPGPGTIRAHTPEQLPWCMRYHHALNCMAFVGQILGRDAFFALALEGGGLGSKRVIVEGTRTGRTKLVVGGRRAPEDGIVMLGLGSGVRRYCASSRRRDVEEGRTRTCAWVRDVDLRLAQFSSATAGTVCSKRDEADMYAWPEMHVVRSATPRLHCHHLPYLYLPPSLPFFPLSTFADAHQCAIDTIASAQTVRIVANNTISDGVGVMIVAYASALFGAGGHRRQAPPPCEQVPAALLVEFVLLPAGMRRLLRAARGSADGDAVEQLGGRWYTLLNGNASGDTGSPCSCCQQRKRVCERCSSGTEGRVSRWYEALQL